MFKDVHDGGLGNTCNHIVDHRSAHDLFYVLNSLHEIASLYKIIHIRTLLFFRLLIECNELKLSLIPFVSCVQITKE